MDIRLTQTRDWMLLKRVRLAALQDTPTASCGWPPTRL